MFSIAKEPPTDPTRYLVGVIGLGLMGSAFASNLLSKGYTVHVYNRTKEKAKPLVDKGAILHPTAKDLASSVDIVITSLTDQNAIDSVALGDNGFLRSMKKGSVWIDMSTIDPSASDQAGPGCEGGWHAEARCPGGGK